MRDVITTGEHLENVSKNKNKARKRPDKKPVRVDKTNFYTGQSNIDPFEDMPELTFPTSAIVYDEMTRKENKIEMIINSIVSSLANMDFYLDCEDDDPMKDIVQANLDSIGLKSLITECANGFKYGFSCFEKVWRMNEKGDMVLILFPIFQRTIDYIAYDWVSSEEQNGLNTTYIQALKNRDYVKYSLDFKDRVNYIQQNNEAGEVVYIAGNKLTWFTYKPENGLVTGVSVLRSIYRDYIDKQRLRILNIQKHSKQVRDDTIIRLGQQLNKNNPAYINAVRYIRNRHKTTHGGIIVSKEDEVINLSNQTNTGNANPITEDMKYYDTCMLAGVFMSYAELGSEKGTAGNRSLSDNIKDTSRDMMFNLAELVLDYINGNIIKEIVARNSVEKVNDIPKLKIDKKERVDFPIIVQLLEAGAIDNDSELKRYVRDNLGIPKASEAELIDIHNKGLEQLAMDKKETA